MYLSAVYKYIYQEASSEEAVPVIRSIVVDSKLDISTSRDVRPEVVRGCIFVQ